MLVQMRQCDQCKQMKVRSDVYYRLDVFVMKLTDVADKSEPILEQHEKLDKLEVCSVNCINLLVGQLTNKFVPDSNGSAKDEPAARSKIEELSKQLKQALESKPPCAHGHKENCGFGCHKP